MKDYNFRRRCRQRLLNAVFVFAAGTVIAMQAATDAVAEDNSLGSENPQDVCAKYPLIDRLDCQTCVSQRQPVVRCEAEAFLGEGPLRTMMKGEGATTVIRQFPLSGTSRTEDTPQPEVLQL